MTSRDPIEFVDRQNRRVGNEVLGAGNADHNQPLFSSIRFDDTSAIDAFGRLRVSNSTGLFDVSFQYDKQPELFYEDITNNSGSAATTHLPNESSVQMTVGANDTIIRSGRGIKGHQRRGSARAVVYI